MPNHRTDTKGSTVKVTLIKSPIGFNRNQLAVVKGLGLPFKVWPSFLAPYWPQLGAW